MGKFTQDTYDDSYDPTLRRQLLIDQMNPDPNAAPTAPSAPPGPSPDAQVSAPTVDRALPPSPTAQPAAPIQTQPVTGPNGNPLTPPMPTGGNGMPSFSQETMNDPRFAAAYANLQQMPTVNTMQPGANGPALTPVANQFYQPPAPQAPTTPQTPTGGQRPTGGNLSDPNFAAQFVAWAATQPGVNPSVKNDPGYWIGRFTSGAFGNDQNYALQRMMQPEGPPEGGGGAPQNQGGGFNLGGVSFNPATGYQFGYTGQLPPEIADFYKAQTAQMQAQQQQQAQIQQTMRDALLKMMAQGQEPVDVQNDQTLGPAAAAYRNARNRGAQQTRDALAERLSFEGLNPGGQGSGAFDTAIQGNSQNAQQDIAGYEAQLAQNELQNRRQLLVQALSMAQALGARTESNQLQQELAQMDAQLRYTQLGQQQSQFEDTMGLNYANLQQQGNRDALLQLLYG